MKEKQHLAFFLPSKEKGPVGGYKIVYEYANKFVAEGYNVSIIYPYVSANYNIGKNLVSKIKFILGFCIRKLKRTLFPNEWFKLDSKIKKKHISKFTDKYIKKFNKYTIIATAIRTAFELNDAKTIPTKQKYYFIQDFESWGISDEEVYNSYRLPLKKITIAPWLQERVKQVGHDALLIPNGFDFEYFKLTNPIEKRCPTEVAMLYHEDDRKRCVDSMAALEEVKKKIPDLHVTMFGTPERPSNLPEWFTYYQCPDRETHNAVYNNAAIFVAASKAEGFGLTVGEAMICGCSITCTNNGGFSCMAIHDKTALLSPVFDVESLAHNIITLIKDDNLRIRLAKTGNEYIKQFTWEQAFNLFKKAIED